MTCETLSHFALNQASHRALQAAATFQMTLNLLEHYVDSNVSVETEAMVRLNLLFWTAQIMPPC